MATIWMEVFMQVSIRDLKNHLSEYLRRVKKGERIIVTSHNIPLARLLPIPQSEDEDLQALLQMEGISWNGKKPKGGKVRPEIKGKNVSDYVIEDRR